jgi:hypothetical protein
MIFSIIARPFCFGLDRTKVRAPRSCAQKCISSTVTARSLVNHPVPGATFAKYHFLWYFVFMSSSPDFPSKGFHIERDEDTPYGPMDMLVENEGRKLDMIWATGESEQPADVPSNVVEPNPDSKEQTKPDQK